MSGMQKKQFINGFSIRSSRSTKLAAVLAAISLLASAVPAFAEKVSDARQKLITYSLKFRGTPYLYGATGPDSFDCSGFVFTMIGDSCGIKLPHSASGIFNSDKMEHISPTVREPGDLTFFKSSDGTVNHVAIYLGKRKFIHAASDGPHTGVIVSTLDENYWHTHYAGSARFLPTTKQAKGE